jgi:hypothetical protein
MEPALPRKRANELHPTNQSLSVRTPILGTQIQ